METNVDVLLTIILLYHNHNTLCGDIVHMQRGRTALYWAAYRGCVDIVQVLIDYGAAVDLGRDKVVYVHIMLKCIIENMPT